MSELEPTGADVSADTGGAAAPVGATGGGSIETSQPAPVGAQAADEFAELALRLEHLPGKETILEQVRGIGAKRAEAEERLKQFEGFEGWLPAINRLAEEYGVTPDRVLQYLDNPQQPEPAPAPPEADPANEQREYNQRFGRYLAERNLLNDWDKLGPAQQATLTEAFELREWRQKQDESQRERERQVETQQWEHKLDLGIAKVHQDFPDFQSPVLTQTLRALAYQGGDPIANAKALKAEIDRIVGNALTGYSRDKAEDGSVPVASGGSSPPPSGVVDFHSLPEDQRMAMFSSYLQSLNRDP